MNPVDPLLSAGPTAGGGFLNNNRKFILGTLFIVLIAVAVFLVVMYMKGKKDKDKYADLSEDYDYSPPYDVGDDDGGGGDDGGAGVGEEEEQSDENQEPQPPASTRQLPAIGNPVPFTKVIPGYAIAGHNDIVINDVPNITRATALFLAKRAKSGEWRRDSKILSLSMSVDRKNAPRSFKEFANHYYIERSRRLTG